MNQTGQEITCNYIQALVILFLNCNENKKVLEWCFRINLYAFYQLFYQEHRSPTGMASLLIEKALQRLGDLHLKN